MNVQSGFSPRPGSCLLPLAGGAWLDALVLLLAALACFATPLLTLRLTLGEGPATPAWFIPAALGVALCFGIAAWMLARRLPEWSLRAETTLMRLPLLLIILLGLSLRLAWVLAFPAEPGSDSAIYTALARQLASGGAYEISGTHAYWPAGYPLFLSAWMKVLGPGRLAWLLSNMVLFVIALTGVARIATLLGGSAAGRLAALLLALWPNLIASTATPDKEAVIIALLPWACWIVASALRERGAPWRLVWAGLLLGGCILVQPSLQLLPLAACGLLVAALPLPRALGLSLLLALGIVLAIAPWTARNYSVFGQFVLVSTNGGDNLYRANNPLATGGYTRHGEIDLSALPELERDREGKRLAQEWIRTQPAAFAALAVEKQLRFMGDDAAGIYSTLKVGKASDSGTLYLVLKAAANAWWLAMWTLLAAAVFSLRAAGLSPPALARLPLWLWLYLFALHSIFESAGKYHMPVLWVLPVLIACSLVAPWARRTQA